MNYRYCLLALCILCAASCRKDKTSSLDGNWLFPVAKGSISLNTLNELKNITYNIDVPALSIGQPTNIPVSSPGLSLPHVGPFPLEISPWLHRIDVDTLEITGSLNNIFPIPIGAGTKVTIRSSRDTGSTASFLGSTLVATDIAPGGLLDFDFRIFNKTIGDSVYFFLDDFSSPPYSNVVFSTTPTRLKVTLKVITASYIEIYSGKTFASVDTVSFSAGSDDQLGNGTGGAVSDTSVSGTVNLFLDNRFPAHITGQLYFMNDTRTQVIDSLFTTPFTIAGALTDAAGNPVNVVSTVNRIPITRQKVDHIKQAAYVVSNFRLNTGGYTTPWVSANKSARLDIQLTGDLNIRINF